MKRLPLLNLIDRLEDASILDPLSSGTRKIVNAVVSPRWLRDILHGVPIGHPVHPLAVQVPLGVWTAAALLDAVPGTRHETKMLIGIGVISALPAAVAGYTDWSELHEQQQRVGLVHSAGNLIATTLYAASFIQRSRGKHSSGKALSYAGFAIVAGAGFLGGHLSYRQAAGVNHAEEIPHRFPAGWHPLAPLAELPVGELTQRTVSQIPLLVYRESQDVDDINVLSDDCSHLSAPLHEGRVVGGSNPCVECPWHQSVFSLRSGEVVHGPATSAQPRFLTRLSDGVVEICLPGAG